MPKFKSFRAIAEDLEQRIRSGEYPPGGRFPSYAEIAAMYSVSKSTAYRVSTLLVERGLVDGVPGRGTFVAEKEK